MAITNSRIGAGEIWETPSKNFALTARATDRIEAAVDYYESLLKSCTEEQILNEAMEILFQYYEFATIVYSVYKDALPAGLRSKVLNLIDTINENAEKHEEGID